MNDSEMGRLATLLVTARKEARQIRPLAADLVPANHAEGYAVNARVARGLGWEPAGWKIAATNAQMQQRLRTSEPIYGRTYRRFVVETPAVLVHSELLDPLVECELFFVLGRDLPAREDAYVEGEVADATARVHVGIEVAECRFPRDALPPMPAVLADGAASGRYVVGAAIEGWRARDLSSLAVTLTVNDVLRRSGSGGEVMGDPIRSLVWLANQRRAWGDGLKAGELVSTGTTTGMLLARAGDRMVARFGDVGEVRVDFA